MQKRSLRLAIKFEGERRQEYSEQRDHLVQSAFDRSGRLEIGKATAAEQDAGQQDEAEMEDLREQPRHVGRSDTAEQSAQEQPVRPEHIRDQLKPDELLDQFVR